MGLLSWLHFLGIGSLVDYQPFKMSAPVKHRVPDGVRPVQGTAEVLAFTVLEIRFFECLYRIVLYSFSLKGHITFLACEFLVKFNSQIIPFAL